MRSIEDKTLKTILWVLFALILLGYVSIASAAIINYSATHTFSVNDVQGGFNGSTYGGVAGSIHDPGIICGLDVAVPCPDNATQPIIDKKTGQMLYPVDSEFGFYVTDFVGAAPKQRDNDYAEGWVANVVSEGEVIGITISNAATDTFKVKPPMGTWCAGLGANTVKCSTEHYTVLEHIKTCYETIPYRFANPETGVQGNLIDPATTLDPVPTVIGTCEEGRLDNDLFVVENGLVTQTQLQPGPDGFPNMVANESTVRGDIAVNTDYAITKKDDGKALYRFGSLIKRPNDVRLYARIPLPQEWKDNPGVNFPVLRAELHVDHLITNNPNDQLRPEDMENEGATGRKPGYLAFGDVLLSDRDCYEGDGDFIGVGTVYKNPAFAALLGDEIADPNAYSADLRDGFTNAWYTSTDRDPFEADPVTGIGPRWRLNANKFGQDIPGLELPSVECIPVPYTSEFIKYEVGAANTTVINLLDFEVESPLAGSHGWLQPNGVNIPSDEFDGISVNGLPLTEDFDLAVYIKGDRKATAVYNARLIIEYDGQGTAPPPSDVSYDLAITSFKAPNRIFGGDTKKMKAYISNNGPDVASGSLLLEGVLSSVGVVVESITTDIGSIAPGSTAKLVVPWTASYYDSEVINWTATISADGDTTDDNNALTDDTLIRLP